MVGSPIAMRGPPWDWRNRAGEVMFRRRASDLPGSPPMRHALVILALAAGGLTLSAAASAQETAEALPTCASQGLQRVAVMVPPGQTEAQLRETLRSGGL